MDQEIRNKLRNVVTKCRKLLEDSISQELEGTYGIFARKDQVTADPNARMTHLSEEEQIARKDILDHFAHIKARGFKPKDALDQLIREIAFTHLNRLCAYKMMEAREVYVGGQKFREAVSRGVNSNGVKFYLAEHEEDERLFNTGHQDIAYRHFLDWLGGALSDEIGVLFNPNDPANRLYPRQKTLDEVLDLLNGGGIKAEETELREQWPLIWSQDETIGWVYQYFTPKELRDQARKESQAPRNSYELAFRNQFFTPRYVVEFLTDNTLGRIWYEMRKGDTRLKDQCRYMVRRPTEIFLNDGEQPPKDAAEGKDDLSQEELLKLPVHIPHRPKKDPRELKILDPACGSGHFLLYCFDLLLTIYEEAYADSDLGPALKKDYPTLDVLKRDVPRLILAHNLHGIDIDLRASQIAALALWLRCQRAYQEMGLKKDRPKITRSNFVCAEPMPGEEQMLKEFVGQLEPKVLGQVVEVVFDKMKLAGEAGSLLKIEEEIRAAVAAAKKQYVRETTQATDRKGQPLLFTQAVMDRSGKTDQPALFDLSDITDNQFFEQAESRVIDTLRSYAEKAHNGQRLQRRLFSEDAVRGFAFVDLCQKRYDVVLMNPPFGDLSLPSRKYLSTAFVDSSNDIYCCFIVRASSFLASGGRIGVITPRSCFFSSQMSRFRHTFLHSDIKPLVLADLGEGVLDEAANETSCYILPGSNQKEPLVTFIRAVLEQDKQYVISTAVQLLAGNSLNKSIFLRRPSTFLALPDSPFAYWVSHEILNKLSTCSRFEPAFGFVRQGIATTDDFKFVRLVSEVPPEKLLAPPFLELTGNSETEIREAIIAASEKGCRWAFHVKAGASQPWYSPLLCVVDWEHNGRGMKEQRIARKQHAAPSEQYYLLPGFSWTRRAARLVPYIVPSGAIPSASRYEAFPKDGLALTSIAIAASNIVSAFARCYGSDFARPNFLVDTVRNLPFPRDITSLPSCVKTIAGDCIRQRRNAYRNFEPYQEFTLPYLVHPFVDDGNVNFDLGGLLPQDVEMAIGKALGLDSTQAEELCRDLKEAVAYRRYGGAEEVLSDDEGSETTLDYSPRSLHESIVSYAVGVAFGRWDVRFAIDVTLAPELDDGFAPLPSLPPGSLVGHGGKPASQNNMASEEWLRSRNDATVSSATYMPTDGPTEYLLDVQWDGILPYDEIAQVDIVHRTRNALEVIFNERQEGIERDVCEILGVRELRDYFRKPGKGGFWDDHISCYTKSHRKAPIYWLLQSSKKNYALWLYYHRLDKDLLFKALVNYVEPKIRLETSRLESLRSQKAAMGESGKEAKRIAKEVEKQEDFLSELRDFEDKLRRAANLHLDPDLNDGVVLNIAPLWELVPWKEAKKYWDELMEGQYEWSSIGKQLRQKGLVK